MARILAMCVVKPRRISSLSGSRAQMCQFGLYPFLMSDFLSIIVRVGFFLLFLDNCSQRSQALS